jgi:hypothetical protein
MSSAIGMWNMTFLMEAQEAGHDCLTADEKHHKQDLEQEAQERYDRRHETEPTQ